MRATISAKSMAITRPTSHDCGAVTWAPSSSAFPSSRRIFRPISGFPALLELIDAVHQQARQHARDIEVALTAEDIRRIHPAGKIAVLMGVEGGHMIQDSLPVLRTYYRLGVRYMTLTHFKTNDWADSSTDVAAHNGLSHFGREVVREMNRLGMMVDISPRLRQNLLRRAGSQPRAGDCLAFLAAGAVRYPAKYE